MSPKGIKEMSLHVASSDIFVAPAVIAVDSAIYCGQRPSVMM